MIAVITGDIIASAALTAKQRAQIQQVLEKIFAAIKKLSPDFEVEQFRGDSFQGIFTKQPQLSLRAALIAISSLMTAKAGLRVAVGTGDISYKGDKIVTSDGSAFQNSGEQLDELKKDNERIAITIEQVKEDKNWQLHAMALNFLIERWSIMQAEAIYTQLNGLTQTEAAQQLGIKQPAVNQRLQAAGWPLCKIIIDYFEETIKKLS